MLRDIGDQVGVEQVDALRAYLRNGSPNAKRDDALALVTAMRAAAVAAQGQR